MTRPRWFVRSWGVLARAVIEVALEDLDIASIPQKDNPAKTHGSAVAFFEGKWARVWGQAAGFTRNDIEQAYLDRSGDGLDK